MALMSRAPLLPLILLPFALATAMVTGYLWLPRPDDVLIAGVEVRGSPEFVGRIKAALQLLCDRSPDEFDIVQKYVGRIQQAERSGMNADAHPPTLDLSDRTSNYSLTWCAGSIVHDAYHSKLFHDYRTEFGEPVPDSAWRGKAREMECNQLQMSVLKNIGAPAFELEHLSRQDGGHFDLDGDGEETWNDYYKRDW
jgi:hypothetical protein